MHLLGDDDPRDKLAKARLWELMEFARHHGVSEVEEGMPAKLVRKILRGRGLTDIDIPVRRLGQPDRPNGDTALEPATEPDVVEVDAEEDLMRQWQSQKQQPAPRKKTGVVRMGALRKQAKALGIKSERTWKMADFERAIKAATDEPHAA